MKSLIQAVGAYLLLLSTSLAIPKLRVQAAPASAIQVLMVQSDEIKLPAEFQISLYENLIQQLEKKGGARPFPRPIPQNRFSTFVARAFGREPNALLCAIIATARDFGLS